MSGSKKFPGLEFVVTAEKKDPETGCKMSPDIVVYLSGGKRVTRLIWSDIEIFIEWKRDVDADGFRRTFSEGHVLDAPSVKALESRGQIYSYAAQALNEQHRSCVFAVSICSQFARLYRFDPSCVVVSEMIPFMETPAPLFEFFARFAAMTPAERGHDPTVVPATNAEKALFRTRVKEYLERVESKNLRKHPDVESLDYDKTVKIQVDDEVDGNTHTYLACKPSSLHTNYSPCGRLSRGFIATPISPPDPEHVSDAGSSDGSEDETDEIGRDWGKLFWLKDCWRSNSVESEASIYRHLKLMGVEGLPVIRCAGDVLCGGTVQESLNDTLLDDPETSSWRTPTHIIYHMIHYRLVSELLIPLHMVEDARELLLVGRDILNGEYGLDYDMAFTNYTFFIQHSLWHLM